MEKVKDPALILAGVDFLLLSGLAIYSKKEIDALNKKVEDLETALKLTINKLNEVTKETNEAVKGLAADVGTVKKGTRFLVSKDDFETHEKELDNIISALTTMEKPVEVKRVQRKKKRRSKHRSRKSSDESSSSSESSDSSDTDEDEAEAELKELRSLRSNKKKKGKSKE